jgi:ubiquinone/menaquinone biosynthesis C-methylase UbiE
MVNAQHLSWDYTKLARAYAGRPPYAAAVIDEIVATAGLHEGDRVCDLGAGTGHLTVELLAAGLVVDAVEPNAAMRERGRARTDGAPVTWWEATAEDTGRPSGAYALATFGSSFNVVDRDTALAEVARILRRPGWVACLWNHRDLDDPLQRAIEDLIRARVPGYDTGYRRKDDVARDLATSPLFGAPCALRGGVRHEVDADEWVDAWRSHATLARQAGDDLEAVVQDIAALVDEARDGATLTVPYTTRAWVAQTEAG